MNLKKTFRYAFKRTIPILVSWIPVALAYGVLMSAAGYNFLWTGATSLIVYAGSLQLLMISFFTSAVPLITVAIMALLLNSRHIFYGLSLIEKFRGVGHWKAFLIYSLADENYSLHCSAVPEDGVDEKWQYIISSALLVSYWVILSMLGALAGSFIPFDTTGIDFALTALFAVILIDQLRGADNQLPAIVAGVSSVVCLALLGPDNFILPSLLVTVAALIVLKRWIEPEQEVA